MELPSAQVVADGDMVRYQRAEQGKIVKVVNLLKDSGQTVLVVFN